LNWSRSTKKTAKVVHAAAQAPRHRHAQAVEEERAVREAGQRVVERVVDEPRLGPPSAAVMSVREPAMR
jgi:hypothetical protein